MALCYYCNNVANNKCSQCNLSICESHTVLLEQQTPSGGSESVPCCSQCAK
ncbi:MAG: hypothetical protein ACTSO9_06070 [Candidatus Helarchaeota archaeon]